jgi:hypothetical protein
MNTEHQFLVRLDGLRPDFRTVIAFLWSDLHNVDSDGDSHHPASREWTELYLQNREKEEEVVKVLPKEEDPLVLRVISPFRPIALGVSYFLVHWCSGQILDADSRRALEQKRVMEELEATFDLPIRIARAEQSIWNQSTLEKPYPNLKNA